jgi:hypothetical protein
LPAVPAPFFWGPFWPGASLMFTEGSFLEVAGLVVTAHLPVMIIEGVDDGVLRGVSEEGQAGDAARIAVTR